MAVYLLRRAAFAVLVLVTLAVIDFGLYRVLRPQEYGGEGVIGGLAGDLERLFLHFDLGDACMFPGCPSIREIWGRSWAADLYLLAGGLIIGVTAGISGAAPTTSAPPRPRAKRALGQVPTEPPVYDIPMLQALALWAAVLVVVVSTLADLVLVLLDPRVRAAGRPPG